VIYGSFVQQLYDLVIFEWHWYWVSWVSSYSRNAQYSICY